MGISIEIELWTKPSWMLDIEGKDRINVKLLKETGDYFKEHLYNISEIVNKLQKNGWKMCECYGAIYHLSFYKNSVSTLKEAKLELKKLGINTKDVFIDEYDED